MEKKLFFYVKKRVFSEFFSQRAAQRLKKAVLNKVKAAKFSDTTASIPTI